MRSDVLRFGKIRRTRIQRCVQIINVNSNPVRYAVVVVAAVIVRVRWKDARERVHPRAGTDLVLVGIEPGAVRIRAPRAQLNARTAIIHVTGAADAVFQCSKRMFHPGLAICSKRSLLFAPPLMR